MFLDRKGVPKIQKYPELNYDKYRHRPAWEQRREANGLKSSGYKH